EGRGGIQRVGRVYCEQPAHCRPKPPTRGPLDRPQGCRLFQTLFDVDVTTPVHPLHLWRAVSQAPHTQTTGPASTPHQSPQQPYGPTLTWHLANGTFGGRAPGRATPPPRTSVTPQPRHRLPRSAMRTRTQVDPASHLSATRTTTTPAAPSPAHTPTGARLPRIRTTGTDRPAPAPPRCPTDTVDAQTAPAQRPC